MAQLLIVKITKVSRPESRDPSEQAILNNTCNERAAGTGGVILWIA
jgi:hypothetical protein